MDLPPTSKTRAARLIPLVLLVVLGGACTQGAEYVYSDEDPRTYLRLENGDTTGVEVFTRHADLLEGILVYRYPIVRILDYSVSFDSRGGVSRIEGQVIHPQPDGRSRHIETWELVFRTRDVLLKRDGSAGRTSQSVETRMSPRFAMLGEQGLSMMAIKELADQIRSLEDPQGEVAAFSVDSEAVESVAYRAADGSQLTLTVHGVPYEIAVRPDGMIMGARAPGIDIRRVPPDDILIDDMAYRWARARP